MDGQRPDLSAFTTYRLHLLNRLFDTAIAADYRAQTGLDLGEARAVAALGHFGAMRIMDVGRRANLEKSKASRAVESLLKKGLLSSARDPADARAIQVALSAAGERCYPRVLSIATMHRDRLLNPLDAGERRVFDALLERLLFHASALSSERAERSDD
ncbi:MarR family winged helix-turn-helix transcriptional regulator [Chitinasiproducens palmae]|uniref:DNA-binding transcriptional regulator, MarR family n=1 Tax=Chitinasiproducens palmae TaxID=1770053 RepID=A0A1H2PR18_9BURK|nr:MarR family winged helix-turn-helix transcriptional regulator [Chitinasiproducens palmae]SDV49318.1 DNA-binding transcriptional regulator, MarR family [Chitinasiproducens palmae]